MQTLRYGRSRGEFELGDLTELQRKAYYEKFLQINVPKERRKNIGLEAILREIFPIKNYDGSLSLEYVSYEIGKPRYTPEECKELRLTYGAPLKIRLRLVKTHPVEEDVYLGDIPLMIGGGEFIINGAERVIVSQLHRSPGIDFMEDRIGDKKVHSAWIVPERGSWIEIAIARRDVVFIRIDQGGRIPATAFLRALSPEYSSTAQIIRLFYSTKRSTEPKHFLGKYSAVDIVNPENQELLIKAGRIIPQEILPLLKDLGIKDVEYIAEVEDPLVLLTLQEDETESHEAALLKIYSRIRPGSPPSLEKARQLFYERFFDPNRYRLGRVGRFRINRKFASNIPETQETLVKEDIVNAIRYLMKLRKGEGQLDDIDHLGNRRLRTCDELACDEIRKGFLRLKRNIMERLSVGGEEDLTPRSLINVKTISSAIEYFFARGELSQVVDQTNPLSQLTHERRLSALGPGGLERKRAGFEVRDVHSSHYGRICPIETPEGMNIGLISSLALYAKVDSYGFLTTPYRVVKDKKVTDEIVYLRADQEHGKAIASYDVELNEEGRIVGSKVLARVGEEFKYVNPEEVSYVDIAPNQILGVSAALIPFLEHDDANRALMGSNMERQAVPLIRSEAPIVLTGIEKDVAKNTSMAVRALRSGIVKKVDAEEIVIDQDVYKLRKFIRLNERTCLNQKPIVREAQRVKAGEVIADGPSIASGEFAPGRNLLVAFMSWEGYNFEDAIIVSRRLLREDVFTSIHIEEFEIEARETKLGKEEFTKDIPNESEKKLRNLTEDGIIREGAWVRTGDILVGKIAPKAKSELTPEEKLLHAIFGRAGEDVKNESLEVPPGIEGVVIRTRKFSRKVDLSPKEKKEIKEKAKKIERDYGKLISAKLERIGKELGRRFTSKDIDTLRTAIEEAEFRDSAKIQLLEDLLREIEFLEGEKQKLISQLTRGEELPTGVLEMAKVYIATKRNLSEGDKMAGRHGNKGVIARILPEEDMPFLEDGTPIDIILNPLGVPSRMNVGQILESHLGWAAKRLGVRVITPPFDGCTEKEIEELLEKAGLPKDGKVTLYDGRTGEPFEEKVTVGVIYMMKLHHLVDDKIHARATGPYSLITQQPLGGKARAGGQRFGEMEVWALEAYGAANVLQEMLTVKSDDVDGRARIYESMIKGENIIESDTPVSFEVLMNEIKGLGLSIKLEKGEQELR